MKIVRKVIDFIRSVTPLRLRWIVGPYLALFAYFVRVYILNNPGAPKVLSTNDTLDLILKENLSVIRFGDGEISVMDKVDMGFQKANDSLALRIEQVIRTNKKGLLICVPNIFGKIEGFTKLSYWFALHQLFRYKHKWTALLSRNQVYGDALITRPYLTYNNSKRKDSGIYFKKLFSIWEAKEVVLVEGQMSRIGVGNDLFKGALSVKRILCPAENAYSKYDQILNAVLKFPKNYLILVSLGPAAKVLAYDLFEMGYRAVDIGHIDMEYEMFSRNEPAQVKVKYKYFNEIKERNPEDCLDPLYLSQIVINIK
jgi:glycosyltransferase family protein